MSKNVKTALVIGTILLVLAVVLYLLRKELGITGNGNEGNGGGGNGGGGNGGDGTGGGGNGGGTVTAGSGRGGTIAGRG